MGDHLKATRKLAVNDVYIPVKRKMTSSPIRLTPLPRA